MTSPPINSWELELEKSTSKYHLIAAWVAIVFDPLFAITDYFNIPESWGHVLIFRLCVAAITLAVVVFRRYFPSYYLILVPFALISLQNAYTYSLIGDEDLLGHNLNYMALFIGASMFAAWDWQYSVTLVIASAIASAYFIGANNSFELNSFFVKGGLILMASAVFMIMLIKTRHDLTIKEIKARVALELSNAEIQSQNREIREQNLEINLRGEEIRAINENLEALVSKRTAELEKKNKALEEYAFINAHKLRSPVASILGLINLLNKTPLTEEGLSVLAHLQQSTDKLDEIVNSITKVIERGERS
ncbi:MAG: histidine kinase dimerization/phospho-acceptor domain-containing protein [Chryseolinea sp.]